MLTARMDSKFETRGLVFFIKKKKGAKQLVSFVIRQIVV